MDLGTGPYGARSRRLKGLSFNRMIPNILTLLALCAGMTSIRFGLQDRWEAATLAIAISAVLDALDGRIARLLKGSSRFGAELDSLSDFICFGVAPAILLHLWALEDAGRFAWIVSLLLAACCGLRLARFNTMLEDPDAPPWQPNFFVGVPAPAGAGLVLLPMILSFQIGDAVVRQPGVVAAVMVIVAALLVSRVPTYSFKKLKVPNRWILPTMVIVVLLAAGVLTAPWATLSGVLFLYLLSFPFSIRRHAKLRQAWLAEHGSDPSVMSTTLNRAGDDEEDEDEET